MNLSCSLLSELKDRLPLFSLPEFQEPDSNPQILPWGRGRREPAGGPGLEAALPRHSLSGIAPFPVSAVPILYAAPHPLLFWSWEIKGRLNYSNLNEASWVEVLLTLRAKMGSTWGHRWVEALCAWPVRYGCHLWLDIKPCIRRIYR